MLKTTVLSLFAFSLWVLCVLWGLPREPTGPSVRPRVQTPSATSVLQLGEAVRLRARFEPGFEPGTSGRLVLRAQARGQAPAPVGRRDVVFVLDRSGSMGGAGLDAARGLVEGMAEHLNVDDRVAIVSYANDVSLDLPLTALRNLQAHRVEDALSGLLEGGGTDLAGGLQEGLRQLPRPSDRGRSRHLVLVTDGDLSSSILSRPWTPELRQAEAHGVSISAVLFQDAPHPFLERLARVGGGRLIWGLDRQNNQAELEAHLTGGGTWAAQNVTLEVLPRAGWTVVRASCPMDRYGVLWWGNLRPGEERDCQVWLQDRSPQPSSDGEVRLRLRHGQGNQGWDYMGTLPLGAVRSTPGS